MWSVQTNKWPINNSISPKLQLHHPRSTSEQSITEASHPVHQGTHTSRTFAVRVSCLVYISPHASLPHTHTAPLVITVNIWSWWGPSQWQPCLPTQLSGHSRVLGLKFDDLFYFCRWLRGSMERLSDWPEGTSKWLSQATRSVFGSLSLLRSASGWQADLTSWEPSVYTAEQSKWIHTHTRLIKSYLFTSGTLRAQPAAKSGYLKTVGSSEKA